MKISRDEARRIATLAHLEFDDAALDRMAADMTEILGYVEQLATIDVRSEQHDEAAAVALRDDVPREGVDRATVEVNAPLFRDGFFVVPRVIGGGE